LKNKKGGEKKSMEKKITVVLDDEMWKEIKIAAIEKGKSLQEYVKELIQKEVKSIKKEKEKR